MNSTEQIDQFLLTLLTCISPLSLPSDVSEEIKNI